MIDYLRSPRVIAANTLAGMTLAAITGCSTFSVEQTPQERIDASYSKKFIDDPKTVCYDAVVDHGSVQKDLLDELKQHPELDVDELSGKYDAASNINTILEAIHELANDSENDKNSYPVQKGDTYEFCVNDGKAIGPGDPINFSALER